VNIIVGSHVWIEDPDISWVDGQVSKITGQDAEIETTNGKKVLYFLLIFTLINLHTYSIEMLQKLYKEKANSEYMLFYFGYF
jgi:myosin V